MIAGIVWISFFVFPFYVIGLNVYLGWRTYEGVVSCFIVVHALYRTWETFFTSRDRKRLELRGDWTLLLTSVIYVLFHFALINELFLCPRRLSSPWIIVLGGVLYFLSLYLRCWGELALGKQWSIHAAGAKKIRRVRILMVGPYRYVRHPIYLGIMIEAIGIALIGSAVFSLAIAVFIFIPAMILRAFVEEKYAIRRFGDEKYCRYKQKTRMFFSLRLFGR